MSSDQVPDRPRFSTIARDDRLSDKVVAALTASILDGTLAVGERLPSERALCEELGVSRPVVREAVRSLLATGLLAEHPRRGHVVATVQPAAVSQSLLLYIRGRPIDYDKLAEARSVLEVETAGLAARRATPEQAAEVAAAADRLREGMDAATAAVADVDFHRAIAVAGGNEFFVILIDSLRDALLDVQRPTLADPKINQTARRAHRRIADAIVAGDPGQAREAMRAHLQVAHGQMRDLIAERGGPVVVD